MIGDRRVDDDGHPIGRDDLHEQTLRDESQLLADRDALRPSQVRPVREIAWIEDLVADVDLVVVDACTDAMSVDGLSGDSNADVARWIATLVRRLARLGPAVVVLDHVTKSSEGRGRWAIGGQHKLAEVDGAAYAVTVLVPLAPTDDPKGRTGSARIKVVKDRPGQVRRHATAGAASIIGVAMFTAWPDGGITAWLDPPSDADTAEVDPALLEQLITLITATPGINKRALRDSLAVKAEEVDRAVAHLIITSRVEVHRGRSHEHYLAGQLPTEP